MANITHDLEVSSSFKECQLQRQHFRSTRFHPISECGKMSVCQWKQQKIQSAKSNSLLTYSIFIFQNNAESGGACQIPNLKENCCNLSITG